MLHRYRLEQELDLREIQTPIRQYGDVQPGAGIPAGETAVLEDVFIRRRVEPSPDAKLGGLVFRRRSVRVKIVIKESAEQAAVALLRHYPLLVVPDGPSPQALPRVAVTGLAVLFLYAEVREIPDRIARLGGDVRVSQVSDEGGPVRARHAPLDEAVPRGVVPWRHVRVQTIGANR